MTVRHFLTVVACCAAMVLTVGVYPLHAAGRLAGAAKSIDKDYYLLLFGFKFLLPEIVTLDFNDNGTFSLSSDLFDAPAKGTYDRGIVLIKGQGGTGMFFDVDFQEQISIDYTLAALPIGFRSFYLMGIGKREFTFFSDNFKIIETFIFQGPGL